MERMKDLEEMLRELSEKYKNSKSVEVYEEDLEGWFKIIDDLREENKSLKANVEFLHQCLDDRDKSIQYAEEENKKLNIKVASLEGEIKGLNSVIDKLHNEIEEQEAEGGGLFDEIDYRKREAKRLGWKPNK